MVRWFHNRSKKGVSVKRASKSDKGKRPRATNAIEVFAAENKEIITQEMSKKRVAEGSLSKDVNLADYVKIRKEVYEDLDDAAKAEYQLKAEKQNEKLKNGPDINHVFE